MKEITELKEVIMVEDAVRIKASLPDFDGNVGEWKDAFYQVWRFQMTWHFAHEIKVAERRGDNDGWEVYISILCKPSYVKNIIGAMEDLGYRNITTEDEKYGEIYAYETSDKFFDLGIETVILAYA